MKTFSVHNLVTLGWNKTFLYSFRAIQPFPLRPLFVLFGSFSVPTSISLCSLKCECLLWYFSTDGDFASILQSQQGKRVRLSEGMWVVYCLVWSRGLTALTLILWRPSLPQRAELLIKKPSAQTEPFHLEPWHPWHSLCLFIAVLLAARSQFCLKATWMPLKRTIDECYRFGLDLPRSDLNIKTISADRMSLKREIWIYLWPSVWFVCHPFKTDLWNTPLAKPALFL